MWPVESTLGFPGIDTKKLVLVIVVHRRFFFGWNVIVTEFLEKSKCGIG